MNYSDNRTNLDFDENYQDYIHDIRMLYNKYCETYENCMLTLDMRIMIPRISEKLFFERIHQEAGEYPYESITHESDIELNYYYDSIDNKKTLIVIGVYKYDIHISYSK